MVHCILEVKFVQDLYAYMHATSYTMVKCSNYVQLIHTVIIKSLDMPLAKTQAQNTILIARVWLGWSI